MYNLLFKKSKQVRMLIIKIKAQMFDQVIYLIGKADEKCC